jgi:putative hemolysin
MNTVEACAVILLLVLVNALFAMGEMALVSARQARFAELIERGVPGASTARAFSADPQIFLPTVQVGITLVSVLEGSFGGAQLEGKLAPVLARIPLLKPIATELAFGLVVVCITFLMLVLGELVPKQLALTRPEQISARLAGPLGIVARVVTPAVWVLNRTSSLVLRLIGAHKLAREQVTEEELRQILAEGTKVGVLERGERDMIERLLRLADKSVRAIMTPRNEIEWIDRGATRDEVVAKLRGSGHSRLVVCEGGPDNPIGVLHGSDVLDCILAGGEIAIGTLLRKPIILPDTLSALDTLERIRDDKLGLALVLDEYGSFEGVVSAADVMEAIVVDAVEPDRDENDTGEAAHEFLLDGMTPVDEVKDRLRLPELPASGSYHTLAGLILALLRRVPAEGDKIVFAGWLFEVVTMDGRRVERVRASRETLAQG